ncbi:MAG TPA: hypothetical protein VNS63_02305 [Blastocatellia bacterium]|nr:hypothetical protein [Blastocatellia bacterium]
MKRLNLTIGVLAVIVFLITGLYMRLSYRMDEIEMGLRMLLRSRHIYILLSGLMNVGVGLYCTYHAKGWRRILQRLGSVLIAASPLLLVAAFFYESKLQTPDTPLSRYGLFTIFGGAMLHLIAGLRRAETETRTIQGDARGARSYTSASPDATTLHKRSERR